MANQSQVELDIWLTKNNPQVQHMLQNNEIKQLLLEVYEEGKKIGKHQYAAFGDDSLEEDVDGPDAYSEDYENMTDYSSLLTKNL